MKLAWTLNLSGWVVWFFSFGYFDNFSVWLVLTVAAVALWAAAGIVCWRVTK